MRPLTLTRYIMYLIILQLMYIDSSTLSQEEKRKRKKRKAIEETKFKAALYLEQQTLEPMKSYNQFSLIVTHSDIKILNYYLN